MRDDAEIQKFNALSESWWDAAGPMKALHAFNPVRLEFVESFCLLQGQRVLDVGCGGGLLSEAMAAKGAIVTAIDLAADLIEVAREHALSQKWGIDYQVADPWRLIQQGVELFDVITNMEMLEHVPDPAAVIQACADLLKPGGWAFFSTIHRTVKSFLKAIVGAEYVLGLLPVGTHQYRQFIKPAELNQAAQAAGLQCQALRGMHYNPFTGQAVFSSDVTVNYLMAFQKQSVSVH